MRHNVIVYTVQFLLKKKQELLSALLKIRFLIVENIIKPDVPKACSSRGKLLNPPIRGSPLSTAKRAPGKGAHKRQHHA